VREPVHPATILSPVQLETERLVLRPPVERDVASLDAIYGDPEVTRYIKPRSHDENVEWIRRAQRRFDVDGFGQLVVVRKSDERLIGRAGLLVWDARTWEQALMRDAGAHAELEVGWAFARDCWGRGYATEAGAASRDYAFRELGRSRVVALIDAENVSSIAVAERLGLAYERDVLQRGVVPVRLYALVAGT
jgi:RimJ/RimL family protein N-acetyltransferase